LKPRNLLLLFLSFFITCTLVSAQQEAGIWYFGENAGLDFRSGTPVPLLDGELDTLEGCATISDFNGNLLFYTDGITVWNRNHLPMPNGTGLLGDYSSTQSAIMVPHPGNSDQYYIFTADHAKLPDGINYSLVDMSLDGGLGDIIQKNVQLLTPAAEKLTAVRHANGTDIWVLIRDAYADTFLAYRVGPAGVDVNPVITNIGVNLSTYFFESLGHAGGYMKVSPDGTKLAVSNSGLSFELFDFDTATGVLSNGRHLLPLNEVWKQFYGVEFSPSSRFLYACSNSMGEIIQFDTEAADIMASKVVLSTRPDLVGAMQLGIDGRIYLNDFDRETNSNITTLSVIENPNEQGVACSLVYNAIDLGGRRANQGLPPFITSFFQVDIEVDGFCEGNVTTFNSTISDTPISTVWDFGDGNTSNLENPVHTYATAGNYTVSVTVTTASEVRTETKDIAIFETPVANAPGELLGCVSYGSYNIDLPSFDVTVLGTQDPNDFTVNYFISQADADSNTNPLEPIHPFDYGTTAVYARVTNANNGQCYDTTQFNIIAREAPIMNTVTDWTVCDDDTDGFYNFNLSLKGPEIFNGQDETKFEILYFGSQADADTNTNPLPTTYTNTAVPETIFIRLQNIAYPSCFRTGSFAIEVSTGVIANTPGNLEICDDDNDGFSTFNLEDTEPEIIGLQSASALSISYHITMADAEVGLNGLPNSYTNSVAGNQTIYIRVENISDTNCYATTSFLLLVYDTPKLETITNWDVCNDDMDGFYEFNFTDKIDEILNGQDNAVFITSFYTNQIDAEQGLNTIGPFYTNTNTNETIFYRIENSTYEQCFRTGSFQIEVSSGVIANTPTDLEICDDDNDGFFAFDLSITATDIVGAQNASSLDISYHSTLEDALSGDNALTSAYTNTTAYEELVHVRVQNAVDTSCYATTFFTLRVSDTPQLQTVTDWSICDDDNNGFYLFNFNEKNSEILGSQSESNFTISYHETLAEAELGQSEIVGNYQNTSNPQVIYYKLESASNPACFVTDSFQIEVFNTPFAIQPAAIITCASQELANQTIDLSQRTTEILGTQDPNQFSVVYFASELDAQNDSNRLDTQNYIASLNEETVYARVAPINLETCYAITALELIINPLPIVPLEERYVICPDSPTLTIDGGDFETWSWQNADGVELSDTRTFTVAELGVYQLTVTITQNGLSCESTAMFEVLSSGAPEGIDVSINGFSDQINVTVTAAGTGPFEYSIDGKNYQLSNEFKVFPGKYTVYVRDLEECRILSEELIAIGYQRFFTPNGDGANEFWNIIGAERYPASQLFIYDRYGKLLAQLSPNSKGWDGRLNGKPLPASDYWFNYQYANNQTMTGHFTLKR
jgi:gliding motility-associated-like protein